MARYVDQLNYFYLSVRSGNTVSLRKFQNGTTTILGTASMPVNLGQWYRLRLEVVGIAGARLRQWPPGTRGRRRDPAAWCHRRS